MTYIHDQQESSLTNYLPAHHCFEPLYFANDPKSE